MAGGAAIVVFDWQLALSREARPSEAVRAALNRMDGSETVVFGSELGLPVRLFDRRNVPAQGDFRRLAIDLAQQSEGHPPAASRWQAAVREAISTADETGRLWPIGSRRRVRRKSSPNASSPLAVSSPRFARRVARPRGRLRTETTGRGRAALPHPRHQISRRPRADDPRQRPPRRSPSPSPRRAHCRFWPSR